MKNGVLMDFNGILMGSTLWLWQQFAIENGLVEILDFPIKHGDFP